MKYFFLPLFLFLSILISCKKDSSTISNFDKNLYDLLFVNPVVKENLSKTFSLQDYENGKIFKVIISRRNLFVRVTIYQIFYNSELKELPSGLIEYKNNIFLYYNGSELILNNTIKREKMIEILKKDGIILEDSFSKVYDSRAVQFDINVEYKIKVNFPAISPFDEEIKKEIFWKK